MYLVQIQNHAPGITRHAPQKAECIVPPLFFKKGRGHNMDEKPRRHTVALLTTYHLPGYSAKSIYMYVVVPKICADSVKSRIRIAVGMMTIRLSNRQRSKFASKIQYTLR